MKLEKKLVLRKEALAELAIDDLRLVVGGALSGLDECSLPTGGVTRGCTDTCITCHCP